MFARVSGTLSMKIEQHREDEYNNRKMNIGCAVGHDNPRAKIKLDIRQMGEGVWYPLSIWYHKVGDQRRDTFQ